jgi:CheY-like chemotaxis protein
MDFAEFFTHGARAIVPLAWKKGLLFLFDVRGPSVFVACDTGAMHEALQQLSMSALELLDDGFIFMSAQVEMQGDQTADLSISIAGTGQAIDDRRVDVVLRRLGLRDRPPAPDTPARDQARVALGTCTLTGATLSFVSNRSDGLLFAFDINVPARPLEPAGPAVQADGARAWLVADSPLTYQSLVRRLQRLGWATQTFSSVQQAAEQLARLQAGMARPCLVIGAESPRVTAEQMRTLRALLPARTQVVLAAALDSRTRTAGTGMELRHWPLSPRELDEFTRRAALADTDYSGRTVPAPLTFGDRPAALVVDDNAVNLLVASGLLQVAGFEVDTATGGAEAIARCRERPPQLVLMDVHMPQMDGLETTRQLRELQSQGFMPHFPILAASADAAEIGQVACRDAGMDGYLSKPLSLEAIRRELQRLLPGLARALS